MQGTLQCLAPATVASHVGESVLVPLHHLGRRGKLKGRNVAVSTLLSTTILASVLIIIVGAASFAANNAVNAHVENAQFDQAKNVLRSLAKVIKDAMLTSHSSGYVRSSFWKTIPQFENTQENLTLTIEDGAENWTYQVNQNAIKIKGGSLVGVLTPKTIWGNDSLLFTTPSGTLGRVRVFQSNGAWVSLDYSRTRCVYVGASDYYVGTGYESFNTVEVTVMNLTFGVFEPGTEASMIVENLGVSVEPPIQVSKDAVFHVSLSGGESADPLPLAELVSNGNGDPEKPALVNVAFINIKVSMLREA